MKRLTKLFTQIDQSNKTNDKVAALAEYFSIAPDSDKVWVIALLSHKRPGRTVNTTLLRQWAAQAADVPLWLFEDSYHIAGDLAETITLLLPPATERSDIPLHVWIETMMSWKKMEEADKKAAVLKAWSMLDKDERFVFNKLITGGFRMGVSTKLMQRGLSKATGIEESILAHRLMGNWEPAKVSFTSLVLEESPLENISRPYPFYLCYPLEQAPAELGIPADWLAEYKWDGIRGQVIVRNRNIYIWSRGEELITEKFPDLGPLKEMLPDGTVLDGEIVLMKNLQVLPFHDLQTRIGRKNPGKKILQDKPAAFIAYDVLEYHGKDFRNEPMAVRRTKLEHLHLAAVDHSENHEIFQLSAGIPFKNWGSLKTIREGAREMQSEGLMLKKLDSTYSDGRKKGAWWKWKLDPMHVDAVLIYAQQGHGRRANLFTDYTFAVWNEEGKLVPFAKAYSGLTDKEFQEVSRFVKANTIERFGPVRSVRPELVFELAFEGIRASGRHKSGLALRFPRISRWRKDKPPAEANTLKDLQTLLNQTSGEIDE